MAEKCLLLGRQSTAVMEVIDAVPQGLTVDPEITAVSHRPEALTQQGPGCLDTIAFYY